MAHVAPKTNSQPRKTLPSGTYFARCFQLIQLGTQEEEYQGEKKPVRKIWLGWEFPTEKDVFQEDKGKQPYTMGRELTFSMHEKATYRLLLESWRGKKFTDEEARTFDAGKLLGAPCQVSVQEYTKKNGEPGVKVGAIIPIPRGTIVDPQINPTQDLSLDESFNHALFADLPKFLRERIEKSPEYQAMNQPRFQPQEVNQEPIGVDEQLPF